MTELSGNKGEWSEMYAFLRIAADGRIYGADGDLNKRGDVFYDVIKIIRQEFNNPIDFVISGDGKSVDVKSCGKVLLTVERASFSEEADYLLDIILDSKGRSFSSLRTQEFMSSIHCYKIKAPSSDKSDITLQIHDLRTGMEPVLGFSIKSKLGHASTLLNPSRTTNFIFALTGYDGKLLFESGEVTFEPNDKGSMKLAEKYSSMEKQGISFDYAGMENDVFEGNLMLIDSRLQLIVAEMLKLHYIHGISSIQDQARILESSNPLGFKISPGQKLYQYKIKKFLAAVALGMKPATCWNGIEDANGGYIVVKEDGEVLCYHIYNRNDFEDYLFKNTRLDTPSTTRYEYSDVYRGMDGRYYVKLNLQIRFK